jgi:hypothetical protein
VAVNIGLSLSEWKREADGHVVSEMHNGLNSGVKGCWRQGQASQN